MFANVERERETGADTDIASADRQVERERERCACVFSFLNLVSLFFTLGTCLSISKFCVDLCKKNLIVRDV